MNSLGSYENYLYNVVALEKKLRTEKWKSWTQLGLSLKPGNEDSILT